VARDGGDQVAGVEKVPERAEEAPPRQAHAGQVHRGQGDPGGHRQTAQARAEQGTVREVEEVGAVDVEDSLKRQHDVLRNLVYRGACRR